MSSIFVSSISIFPLNSVFISGRNSSLTLMLLKSMDGEPWMGLVMLATEVDIGKEEELMMRWFSVEFLGDTKSISN